MLVCVDVSASIYTHINTVSASVNTLIIEQITSGTSEINVIQIVQYWRIFFMKTEGGALQLELFS